MKAPERTRPDRGHGAELSPQAEDESGQETGEKSNQEGQGLTPCLFSSDVAMYIIPIR